MQLEAKAQSCLLGELFTSGTGAGAGSGDGQDREPSVDREVGWRLGGTRGSLLSTQPPP